MRKPKQLTYPEYNTIVKVGQKLKIRWENGNEEILEVAEFSQISNLPISTTGKHIWLEYVLDWNVK